MAAALLGRALVQPAAGVAGWTVGDLTYFGLAAATVKASGSILLAFSEASAAGAVAGALRGRSVRALLEGGLHDAPPRVLATIAVRLREVERAVTHGAVAGVRALAQLAPILVGLIFVSPSLALVGSALLVPFVLGLAALRRRWRRASERSQAVAEELHSGLDELVCNLDLWRTYGAGARVERVLRDASARAVSAEARAEAGRAALSGMNEVLGALALVGAVALSSRAGVALGDGSLVAFAAICFMAYRPLRDLGDARAWCERGAIALGALERVGVASAEEANERAGTSLAIRSSEPAAVPLSADAVLRAEALGAAEFGPATWLTLAPGESAALVGPTGSGKTTLLRVLLGLERARGALHHADRELTRAPVGPEHRPFAWVPQDAPLVTGTVLENVGLLGSGEEPARRALQMLGAERLLALGGEIIGPGGRALSGGERRLVAIARAIASELPVLLLDEPTAGLDDGSAEQVMLALRRLGQRRTLLVATHDPRLIEAAQRVVRVGNDGADRLAAE